MLRKSRLLLIPFITSLLLVGIFLMQVTAIGTIAVDQNDPGCVTSSGQPDPYTAVYCNITDAVADAASGDTINVAAGTYTDGPQLVITKDLTISGAGEASTFVNPTADTGSSGDARGWFLVNDGITFHLSNMTLDGTGHKIWQAIRHKGLGTISNVTFTQIKYEESGPSYAGTAVAAFGTGPVDIDHSTFSEIGRVGVLYWVDGAFSDNTYTGKGTGDWLDYALDINSGAAVTATDNTISGNQGVASVDGSTSAGILATTYYGAGTSATITGNTLTDNTTGVAVGSGVAHTTSTVNAPSAPR
jgi:hypothetical protein